MPPLAHLPGRNQYAPSDKTIVADDWTEVKAASRGQRTLELQQIVDDDAEDGQRSLVFKPFGGLVELLERELGVFVKGLIVHQFADGALAAVYFFRDFAEVRHHRSRLPVEGVVSGQLAKGAFALGEVGGDSAGVAQDVADVRAVLFHEVGDRPKQGAEVIGAETLGKSFDAAGDAIDSGHEGAEVGLLGAFEGGAGEDFRGGGGTALEGDKIITHQTGEFDDGFGVGFDFVFALDFHRDAGAALFEFDVIDAPDFDPGHFHEVTSFEFLGVLEAGVDLVAAFEEVGGADHFEDDDRDDQREGKEDAESGFEGVFHDFSG